MQQIFLVYLSLLFSGNPRMENGAVFEHGMTWDQIKKKAQTENKYIFLDCFATWCGPCKQMDKQVYTDDLVCSYLSDHFISVKVQLDTAKTDDAEVRAWYAQAHKIMLEYKIGSFPTFIFLSPEGNIVHKEIGFMGAEKFTKLLQQAVSPEEQYYTLVDVFREHKLAYSKMPGLVKGLERIGEKECAMDIANTYIENYLLNLKDQDLFTKENARFIGFHIKSSQSQAFNWYYQHTNSIDSVMGKGFSKDVLDNVISQEEIIPVLLKWDSLGSYEVRISDWANLSDVVRRKYNGDYANRIVLDAQIRWYSHKNRWNEMVYYHVKKIDIYGVDTAESNAGNINNIIYEIIFKHSNDKTVINKAIKWMKIICDAHPDEQDYLDTYANLLYKKGKKRRAISLEEKVFSMNSRNDKEIISNLEKMKTGKPTWPLN